MADEPFLSRWSKRKAEVRTGAVVPEEPPVAMPPPAENSPPAEAQPLAPQALPPVESLTPDSDFTGFMQPEVDEGVKRQALKTLFQDPHFNVMDGLDVYIDDYSKPDPLPESWLAKLNQMARLGAYQDKPAEDPGKPAGQHPEALEKPPVEQGLVPAPSPETSDTPDGGVSPPAVAE